MTIDFFRQIELLTTTHPCITIPGLGAFISQTEDSDTNLEKIYAPNFLIGFNANLKHDDGILATYLSSYYGISYTSALVKLSEYVKDIRKELAIHGRINCGKLGELQLNDAETGSLVFHPNRYYTQPQLYGLSTLSIQKIDYITHIEQKDRRRYSIQQILVTATATAACALLLLLPKTNIDDSSYKQPQAASFIETIHQPRIVQTTEVVEAPVTVEQDESKMLYYIVIAGDTNEARANSLLKKHRQANFPEAKMLESSNRYRIYAAGFENKAEGETALIKFRKEYPNNQDAWLYRLR